MKSARNRVLGACVLIPLVLSLTSCSRDPERAKVKYMAVGNNYLAKGQYGDAAIEFRNALRLDPRFVDAYYQLAQADIGQHDWTSAYAFLEKAIELDPARTDARLDRGRLYLSARQFDKAEEEARFVLERETKNVAADQLLGAALIGEQKSGQALAAFEKVIELRPKDPSAYINLALVEISLQHPDHAEQLLKKAVEIDPASTQAYSDLANFYRLQNKVQEAEQTLRSGIKRNTTSTALYVSWASLLIDQGKMSSAESVLDELRKQLSNSADASMAIGDFYLQQSQTAPALAEYKKALSLSPKNLDVEKRIEDLYLTTKQTQLAVALDQNLTKTAPRDIVVQIEHGRLLLAEGKFRDAAIALRKVIADAPESAEAFYYLAMALWQDGDLEQARSALLDSLHDSPGLSITLQALVQISLAQNKPSDAVTYAQELVHKFPAERTDRLMLGEALLEEGQFRQAEEQDFIAKQLAPNDSVVYLNLGKIYRMEQKWPDAEAMFEKALQFDAHNTEALGQLADVLVTRNHPEQAVIRVQQYISANPEDQRGHTILGTLNFQLKNYSSARAEFQRALQLDTKNTNSYLRLGKVFEEEGQIDLAIANYQKAFDLQPRFAPLATMIGNLYLKKNELEFARQYYDEALRIDPNFPVANANMAWVDAQENKNLDVALGMAQKAKSLMPELPSITDTLGFVLYRKGNYSSAIPLLTECTQKSPSSAECHFHLGLVMLAMGEKLKGRQQLQVALRMNLDQVEAQQAREILGQEN